MQNFDLLASHIKLLILDIDGICTDGRLYFNSEGESLKLFHVHDGLGIKMLMRSGVKVAVISAKPSKAARARMTQLGVTDLYLGHEQKHPAYLELLNKHQLTDQQVAYAGDDLPDLCLIKQAGLGISVPNATSLVKQRADFITTTAGGQGAVREICERIMQAQNTLDEQLAHYDQQPVE